MEEWRSLSRAVLPEVRKTATYYCSQNHMQSYKMYSQKDFRFMGKKVYVEYLDSRAEAGVFTSTTDYFTLHYDTPLTPEIKISGLQFG
ncbi:hypothetical protein AVEN_248557-1 [Araneus ventricosus]|uniref:Uncharacterized protein n=1 Tax=Araneus ventricosus TaxID=182803 RepID=A0A4Y2UY78_ARAVE|nr:hypothetical protein AVEN_248557-1 [Araneus ventricosus]